MNNNVQLNDMELNQVAGGVMKEFIQEIGKRPIPFPQLPIFDPIKPAPNPFANK